MMRRGALYMTASALMFAGVGAGVKAASLAGVPNPLIVFIRNLVPLAVLTPWLLKDGWAAVRTQRFGMHLARGSFGLVSIYCFFGSIRGMPLTDAMLLSYTSPLFMPFIARAWLGEPIPRGSLKYVLLGFIGVACVVRPGAGIFTWSALLALGAGFFGSWAQVGIRGMTSTEPARRIVFYFSLISTAVSALPLPKVWVTPAPAQWALILGTGVCATAGQLLLTTAYRHAPPAKIGPFIYTAVLFAAVVDVLAWKHAPHALTFVGAALIVLAGVGMVRLEEASPA